MWVGCSRSGHWDAGAPSVDFGFVRLGVDQDDVEFLIGVFGDQFEHKAQELPSFAPFVIAGLD